MAHGNLPPEVMEPPAPIRIGVSACLLGEAVRWDGSHRHDAYLAGTLGRVFSFVPVCPEVGIGLGIPRPPIRLEGDSAAPQARGAQERGLEVSARLAAYAAEQVNTLGGVAGYVLKRGSPSCGMERVPVYRSTGGPPAQTGVGIYARVLMHALPLLPVEEAGRLAEA